MKSRRIFGLIAAALMTVSSLAISASATEIEPYNNHEDEYFEFFLVNNEDRTSMRRKEDYRFADTNGTHVFFRERMGLY